MAALDPSDEHLSVAGDRHGRGLGRIDRPQRRRAGKRAVRTRRGRPHRASTARPAAFPRGRD